MAIAFKWDQNDILDLLSSCERDGLLSFIERYIKKDDKILESGCGLARWVKKLENMGYHCIGIEYSETTVKNVKNVWPELDIFVGNILYHPFKDDTFNAVISLGVVEHFEEGPAQALSDIFRILKPRGVGIITVPCFNRIRKMKHPFTTNKLKIGGNRFFEYQFSPEYFSSIVKFCGFEIIEQKPFAIIDGFYHDLDPLHIFVKFNKWKFKPQDIWINTLLSKIPYLHCHMQILIVRKPEIQTNNGGKTL